MPLQDSHLTERELLLVCDGELAIDRAVHLSKCPECRARRHEMDRVLGDFVRLHQDSLNPMLPPAGASRAMLKGRLAQMSSAPRPWRSGWSQALRPIAASRLVTIAAVLAIAAAVAISWPSLAERRSGSSVPVSLPEPSLTPGAVATADRSQVCAAPRPKNSAVPPSLARKVFEEYGMPYAKPQAYEVDYLITPALGGADDIRNLWPQSNADAIWNSRVKDALEDRLHALVCGGDLDLDAAQRDLSSDWIAAYKKYFRTERPLP